MIYPYLDFQQLPAMGDGNKQQNMIGRTRPKKATAVTANLRSGLKIIRRHVQSKCITWENRQCKQLYRVWYVIAEKTSE
jgi:hypothetical protein